MAVSEIDTPPEYNKSTSLADSTLKRVFSLADHSGGVGRQAQCPAMLDMFDRVGVKVTSHMVGRGEFEKISPQHGS